MATRGALGTLFVVLVLAAVSAVLLMGFIASTQAKAQAATESGTFQKVRQVYVMQTADLPDLKLEDVAPDARCIKGNFPIIEMHFTISNRGEDDASVSAPGIGICSDAAITAKYYDCTTPGGGLRLCCVVNGIEQPDSHCKSNQILEFYGSPQITDVGAHERILQTESFVAAFNNDRCPGAFKFTPYVCAGGIEELNDENNYLYEVGSKRDYIICDAGQDCGITPTTNPITGECTANCRCNYQCTPHST